MSFPHPGTHDETWGSVLEAYGYPTVRPSAVVTNEFDHSLYFQV